MKKFCWTYIYVYSFSLMHALFMAYGLQSTDFAIQYLLWAILPSFAVSAVIILCSPYTFFAELFLFLFAGFWNILSIAHAISFQSPFDTISLYIAMSSGSGEIEECLKFYGTFKLYSILFIALCIPLIPWHFLHREKKKWSIGAKIAILVFSVLLLFIPMHSKYGLQEGIKTFGFTKVSSIDRNLRRLFYIEYSTFFEGAIEMNELNITPPQGVKSNFSGKQNIVLIITESTNRNQLSLYGYPRKTTPKLEQEDLIVYQDVISPAPVTSGSIPHMLTFSNLHSEEQESTIYDLFKAAGFKTYHFDGYKGADNNDIVHYINDKAEVNFFIDKEDRESFDKAYEIITTDPAPKKLLVINTGVTHFPYYPYYPEDFPLFTDTPPNLYLEAEPLSRNQYDTAVLYIDTIIGNFLAEIKGIENTLVIFTTDHGQEVANYSTTYGHSNSTSFLSCYEIPFVLYISDDYKESLGDLVFDIHRTYQTDNLIHSIMDISHVSSPLFNPEYSIFNKNFKEHEQLIHGESYKEMKKEMEEQN